MSVTLQWSPDDYRIGARSSNLELKNIINSLCFKSLINKSGPLGPMGEGAGVRAHLFHPSPYGSVAA